MKHKLKPLALTCAALPGGEWTSMAAFKLLHHPPAGKAEKTHSPEHPAMRRLRFDELLAHQIVLRARRYRADKRLATAIRPAADWQKTAY